MITKQTAKKVKEDEDIGLIHSPVILMLSCEKAKLFQSIVLSQGIKKIKNVIHHRSREIITCFYKSLRRRVLYNSLPQLPPKN